MNKIALIDLDSTVANYDKAMAAEMAKIAGPDDPPYNKYAANFGNNRQEYINARRKLIQNQPGFWRNLEPLALGFEIVTELQTIGFELNVLTQGPKKSINAWSEKAEWSSKYLPNANITITQNKALTYGRILVDDYAPYFLNWLKHRPRGLVVCVAHPWNKIFAKGGEAYQSNILRYDGSNTEELILKLKEAYNR